MRTLSLAFFALAAAACTTPAATDATATDATDLGPAAEASADAAPDAPADAAPSCASLCSDVAMRCPRVLESDCATACTMGSVNAGGDAGSVRRDVASCLAMAGTSCGAAGACLRPPAAPPFDTGMSGTNPRDLAGDFTVNTTDGEWNFRTEWTGQDNYLFLFYSPGTLRFGNGADYSADLYNSGITDLLARSPRNTHYFFGWMRDQPGYQTIVQGMQAELAALPEADRNWWRPRVHFLTERVDTMQNWIGTLLTYRLRTMLPYRQFDPVQFAVDRTQRIREVGQLGVLVQGGISVDVTMLANESIYYNFEYDRAQRMARESPTVITLASQQTVHDTIDVDVTLPDQATLDTFDTVEVDLNIECPHHRDGECGAWDYLSYLWVCQPDTTVPDAGVAEGGADAGGPRYACNTEIARWITSYWRETHWVTDISGMLPLLRPGGRTHFRWNASGQWDPRSTDYIVTLSLRLSNRGRGMRPVAAIPLWQGGHWDMTYNPMHTPQTVMVPAGTRRAELYNLVTGHGGVAPNNCAEFCNHEHHFSVNGGMDHLVSFPGAQTMMGCADRVNEGVVPNQHGTWYYGRGGWCPGFDVAPTITDVTSEVRQGMSNTFAYSTTFQNRAPARNMGDLVLSSYLVLWR